MLEEDEKYSTLREFLKEELYGKEVVTLPEDWKKSIKHEKYNIPEEYLIFNELYMLFSRVKDYEFLIPLRSCFSFLGRNKIKREFYAFYKSLFSLIYRWQEGYFHFKVEDYEDSPYFYFRSNVERPFKSLNNHFLKVLLENPKVPVEILEMFYRVACFGYKILLYLLDQEDVPSEVTNILLNAHDYGSKGSILLNSLYENSDFLIYYDEHFDKPVPDFFAVYPTEETNLSEIFGFNYDDEIDLKHPLNEGLKRLGELWKNSPDN